ncbi:MAG TPA: AMP-binding protein [Gemmatimonadaceae bacterium]|nr:AMP-binding protein [Gemmatimonadaceae bacterium]
MSAWALRLYHQLPPGARSLAATVRGRQLQRWRYGSETPRLVDEALARDRWSGEQWDGWQGERLARLLQRAATRVPFYREQWQARRRRGDRASVELLANWPLLDKQTVRANARALVADDRDRRRLLHEHTSGTTGTPLDLWLSRDAVRAWYALFEARWRRWNGVSRSDRWANAGGQLVVPVQQRTPPFWVWNGAQRQLYLSSYHLAPDLLPAYLEALRRYRVRYLWGYASSLAALAQAARDAGWTPPPLAVALSNAEPLSPGQRALIGDAFGCPVRETYGMSEAVVAASECEAGRLHLWPDAGVLEVVDDDGRASAASGELVCTGLLNPDMPLIRYRVGDRGQLADARVRCACGRGLPVLAQVEGRSDDVLFTRDGRRVGRLDPVFKGSLPVREAQIVQERLDAVRLRLVPAPGYTDATAAEIVARLRERLGDVAVTVETVPEIPRGRNGKLRAVVCALPPGERPPVRA